MPLVQWTTPDNKRFFAAGTVVKQLPPNYYKLCNGIQGMWLEAKPTKTENLLRFSDSTSVAVIEEIEKFWQREETFKENDNPYKRGILMYGPPGSGKCLAKGTLIPTSLGLLAIEELYSKWQDNERNIEVLSEDGPNSVTSVIDDGEKGSYKVEFSNGVILEGSERHRVRILSQQFEIIWKRFDELVVGDKVICSGKKSPSSDNDIGDDFAYGCGVITGDGGISVNKSQKRNRIFCVINENDLKNEEQYSSAIEKFFENYLGGFNGWVANRNVFMTNKTCNEFAEKMLENGFLDFDDKEFRIPKRVPKFILESSHKNMVEYLAGLVDSDGYISVDGNCVEFTMNSEGLMRDVQAICSSLGLRTNLTSKFVRDISLGKDCGRHKINKNYWRLSIYSIQSFLRLRDLGFRPRVSYKDEAFKSLCSKDVSTNVRTILPFTQDGTLVSRIYKKLQEEGKQPGSRETYHLFSSASGKGVGLETLQKIKNKFPTAFEEQGTIQKLLENECYFIEVKDISCDRAHMYDLSVENSPTYVVNGIISHNTCTIRLAIENLIKEHQGVVMDWPGPDLFKSGYEMIREVHEEIPIIILMEDIDAILRRSYESDVMNVLDGVYSIDKVVFLATTNYPENLGSRIMNRPSRFDKKIFVGMPSEENRRQYIKSKLVKETESTVERWVRDTKGFSIAHIKELFVASRILGDDYDSSLRTLRKMKHKNNSADFDPYEELDKGGKTYAADKEAYYDSCEEAKPFLEAKKRMGGLLTEGAKKLRKKATPEEIANLLTQVSPGATGTDFDMPKPTTNTAQIIAESME